MKQYFFVKPMATDLHITVSQCGEFIGVIVPGMDGWTDLVEWSVEINVGETPLLYKRIMMPSSVHEHDLMVMIDTIIGVEFTKGMFPVKGFEIQEGDF